MVPSINPVAYTNVRPSYGVKKHLKRQNGTPSEATSFGHIFYFPTLSRGLCCQWRSVDIPPIHPLPQKDTFDFIEIPCGYALIHDKGIFILDDWNMDELDFPVI